MTILRAYIQQLLASATEYSHVAGQMQHIHDISQAAYKSIEV